MRFREDSKKDRWKEERRKADFSLNINFSPQIFEWNCSQLLPCLCGLLVPVHHRLPQGQRWPVWEAMCYNDVRLSRWCLGGKEASYQIAGRVSPPSHLGGPSWYLLLKLHKRDNDNRENPRVRHELSEVSTNLLLREEGTGPVKRYTFEMELFAFRCVKAVL